MNLKIQIDFVCTFVSFSIINLSLYQLQHSVSWECRTWKQSGTEWRRWLTFKKKPYDCFINVINVPFVESISNLFTSNWWSMWIMTFEVSNGNQNHRYEWERSVSFGRWLLFLYCSLKQALFFPILIVLIKNWMIWSLTTARQ